MSTDVTDELRRIAGDHIRAIVRYDDGGIDAVAMTDAARDGVDPETKLPLLRRITAEEFPSEPFGSRQLSVHAFPDAIVLHLPLGPKIGVVATLEPTAPRETLGTLVTTLSDFDGTAPTDQVT